MSRQIQIVEYDPLWRQKYKEEAKLIKKLLGKNCVTVHHIGSTAVKGLPAKPIIDIMPVVKDINAVDALNAEFEKLGYECCGEYGIKGRRYYKKGGDDRTHHVHIFEINDKENTDRHLAFRDYLLAHPDKAKEYGALKKKLAFEYVDDSESYCQGKSEFVTNLEEEALVWHKKSQRRTICMATGMCFGYAIGTAVGIAVNNIALSSLGLAVGMAVGLAIGFVRK